jgi:DNA-binding transcriptional LysR family regulator
VLSNISIEAESFIHRMKQTDDPIEIRTWRQFLVLAQTLHFSRAAEQLEMTQPPLTIAIQQLERRLGVLLFERTRRSVALTAAGAALVEPVRAWLRQGQSLPAVARSAGQGAVGHLRLGFVSTIGFGPLPAWLRGFRKAEPGITVSLHEATTDAQLRAFEHGEADAGFVLHSPGMPPTSATPPLQTRSIHIEPMVLALPDPSPLAQARRLTLPLLLAQPLVIFPRRVAPSLYDALIAFHHRHGATPVVAQEAVQMQTIVNLVSAGLGMAWVPQSMMRLQRPGVRYRRLPSSLATSAVRCETSLAWPQGHDPVVQRFVDFLSR